MLNTGTAWHNAWGPSSLGDTQNSSESLSSQTVSLPNLKWLLDLMASRYPFQSFSVIQSGGLLGVPIQTYQS